MKRQTSHDVRRTAKLTRRFSISEHDALRDMTRNNRVSGSPGVAWHRGHQAGICDAILTLKDSYPRVAEELRKAFGLNQEGDYVL